MFLFYSGYIRGKFRGKFRAFLYLTEIIRQSKQLDTLQSKMKKRMISKIIRNKHTPINVWQIKSVPAKLLLLGHVVGIEAANDAP